MAGVGYVFDTREVWCGKLADESDRCVRGYNHCGAAISHIFFLYGYVRVLVLIEDVDCFNGRAHGKMKACRNGVNSP